VASSGKRAARTVQTSELHAARVVRSDASVLEAIAEESAARAIRLPSQRRVVAEATAEGDRIRIESPNGEVELTVTMTEAGPLLRFRAADLALSTSGDVAIDCQRFDVRAAKGMAFESGGDVREVVDGDKLTKVRGTHAQLARRALVEAKRGDVRIVASDDVEVVGERVKLNC
jgi:hypothetical protein